MASDLGRRKAGDQNPRWVCCLHRSASGSSLDLATLSDQEKHLLLAALMQNYEQKAGKLEREQETEGFR